MESLPAITLEEKMAMEQVERSIKFGDVHYQITIPNKVVFFCQIIATWNFSDYRI